MSTVEHIPPFQALQYRFAAHIRDPDANPLPEGVDDRRMAIYRELFYKNVEGLFAGNFPVIRKLLSDEAWHHLVRRFYAEHAAHTPYFPELGREFVRYLEARAARGEPDPPFLYELAHYEWVELGVSIDQNEIDDTPHDPHGDVVAGRPVVSPLAWPLVYRFPVQQIRRDFQPTEPLAEPTCLIVVRNRKDDVAFMAATPLTITLLDVIGKNPAWTGLECVQAIAAQFDAASRDAVVAGGSEILRQLQARDVILGTRVD